MIDIHAWLVEMRGVSKSYGGVAALRKVDFAIRAGEVRALLGKNGAGKSTLIKIMAGIVIPDAGTISIKGQPISLWGPGDAIQAGVATVHQELSIVPEMSVAENIFLGRWPKRAGYVDWTALVGRARKALEQLGFDIDPLLPARQISVAQRQLVEIARALSQGARILILDEPTSSLVAHEVKALVQVIQRLSAAGVGVVYISHRMDEIRRVAHSVTVMRDGAHVKTAPVNELSDAEIVQLMLGEMVQQAETTTVRGATPGSRTLLTTRELSLPPKISSVSMEIRAGEVLGIAGVLGAGRTELLQGLVGLQRLQAGEMHLDGQPYLPADLRAARQAGVVMTPEDRRAEGAVISLGVDENLVMANWTAVSRRGVIDRLNMRETVARLVHQLGVKLDRTNEVLSNLSGGNQQKVVIGKALHARPRLLLLDEPTRGVDIGAKRQIYALMRQLAEQGMAIVFVSGEFEEFPGVCDRVLVLRQGTITAEICGNEITTQALLDRTMGEGSAPTFLSTLTQSKRCRRPYRHCP